MKKLLILTMIIGMLCGFCACSSEREITGVGIGTFYNIQYTGSADYSEDIDALLRDIELKFSTSEVGSEIYLVNHSQVGEAVTVSGETYNLISYAFQLSEATDNAFNAAIYPLVRLWGFDSPEYSYLNREATPDFADIFASLPYCDKEYFALEDSTVTRLNAAAMLDLGGIAKGYAAQKITDYLKAKGVRRALLNFGGNVGAVGTSYNIGIKPPRASGYSYILSFRLKSGEICSTSGDYEKFFTVGDTRYHHILDTATGYPAASGIISAAVICSNGALADALSTAVLVLGLEEGSALLDSYGAKGIIVTDENKVVVVGDLTTAIKDTNYSYAK